MKRLARVVLIIDKGLVIVVSIGATLAFLSITGLVTYAVFRRYVLRAGTAWGEELPLFFNVWFSLLAGPLVYRNGGHISIEFIIRKFSRRVQYVILTIIDLLIGIFGVFLMFQGNEFMTRIAGARMATVRWPLAVTYLPTVISGALFTFWGFFLAIYRKICMY